MADNWFTPEERETVLGEIVTHARSDERIAGCVLVGSGSYGFTDEYSDIDLCMVTHDDANVTSVADDMKLAVEARLEVSAYCLSVRGPDILLHNFLLASCLEINMCVMHMCDLRAMKPHWKVLFDRTGTIHDAMTQSWESRAPSAGVRGYYDERINAIWHYVLHAYVAIRRGRCWQAISDIEEIRNQTLRLHSLRFNMDAKRNRNVDDMDIMFLETIAETLVAEPTEGESARVLRAAVRCFFSEARSIEDECGLPDSTQLEQQLGELVAKL